MQTTLNQGFTKNRYVLDIETMNFVNDNIFGLNLLKMGLGFKQFVLIGLYDGVRYHQFTNFKDCIEFILNESDISTIYAHNGGKYDYLYLLESEIKNYQYENLISLGSSLIFDLRKGNKKAKCRDSFKIMPNSLDKLAKGFGVETRKIKMNYESTYCLYEIEKYLKHDCISLFQVIKKFEEEIKFILKDEKFNVDKFISLASMSFYILNKNYLKGITANRMPKNVENWIRQAYYGGRTEIFKFHGKNLNYFDVNSLYPYVMKENYYPIGRYKIFKNPEKIRKLLFLGKLGILKANINYPYNYICCLPYKTEDKKLIFPYGKFTGYYTSIEILQAIYEGAEVELIEGVFWFDKAKIFTEFVMDFYSLKQNSKGAKREIAKLILNSSYGKFGQKRKYREIISKKQFLKRYKEMDDFEQLGEGLFYSKEKVSYKNRKVNPIYAIFVTSYARLYLFNLMKAIGEKHIFYCDTDSIICDCEINPTLIHDSDIGKLKREVDIINEGIFISPKFYGLDYLKTEKDEKTGLLKQFRRKSIKIKGVDRDILKSISMKQFREIAESHKYEFKIKRMISFNQKYTRLKFKQESEFVNIDEISKTLDCKYDKRIRNGNDSEPLEIHIINDIQNDSKLHLKTIV